MNRTREAILLAAMLLTAAQADEKPMQDRQTAARRAETLSRRLDSMSSVMALSGGPQGMAYALQAQAAQQAAGTNGSAGYQTRSQVTPAAPTLTLPSFQMNIPTESLSQSASDITSSASDSLSSSSSSGKDGGSGVTEAIAQVNADIETARQQSSLLSTQAADAAIKTLSDNSTAEMQRFLLDSQTRLQAMQNRGQPGLVVSQKPKPPKTEVNPNAVVDAALRRDPIGAAMKYLPSEIIGVQTETQASGTAPPASPGGLGKWNLDGSNGHSDTITSGVPKMPGGSQVVDLRQR